MPRVPRMTGPTIAPSVVREPTDTAASVGMPIVEAVAGAANRFAQIAQEEREKALQTQVNAADVELRRVRDRLLYDQRDGALTRQRMQAKDAPEAFRQRWASETSSIIAGLPKDVQERVRQQAMQVGAEADGMILRHVTGEIDKADVETREALQADAVQMIVANPQDAAMAEAKLAEAANIRAEGLRNRGVTPEAVEQDVAKFRSGVRLAQITALAESNPDAARAALERVGDQLQGQDKVNAQRVVRASTMAVESQRARDTLLAEFPDDEAAALRAVSDRYEGEKEDAVRQRVEAHFADKRRLDTQQTNDLFNNLLTFGQNNGGDLGPRLADLERLRERDPAKAQRLENAMRQQRTGRAAETDYAVWVPLTQMSAEALRSVNPNEYLSSLAPREFNILVDMVARAKGTGKFAAQDASMTVPQFERSVFEMAKADGLLPSSATGMAQLRGEDALRFGQLKEAVDAEIAGWQEMNDNRRPPVEVQRAAIRKALDDQVLETSGWNTQRPRSMVLPTEQSRDLTDDERQALNERIGVREAQQLRSQMAARIRQAGGEPTQALVDALLTLYADPNLSARQKEQAALAIVNPPQ